MYQLEVIYGDFPITYILYAKPISKEKTLANDDQITQAIHKIFNIKIFEI